MLIDDLYTITSFLHNNQHIEATVIINAQHKIFEGHFPQQPVLPGVCMVQMVKENLEKAVDRKLFLTGADQCKFLSMIDPAQSPLLQIIIDYTINDENIAIHAQMKNEVAVFLKMKATFSIIAE